MKVDGSGVRYNKDKVRMAEIPPEFFVELCRHANIGTNKYPNVDNQPNWTLGMSYSDILNSLLRHLFKWMDGQTIDEETGSHHLIAAAWGLMALHFFDTHGEYAQFDDRMFKFNRMETNIKCQN